MSSSIDNSKEVLSSYLHDNDWEKELNYKLWVTKGARFCAAQRFNAINDASTNAISFLTAYLIILGLGPMFVPEITQKVTPSLLGISTVGISILVLAYSLIESSRRYALRAHLYHDCGLRIGRLYDALRQAKSIQSQEAKEAELHRITKKYERTLEQFENHSQIDFAIFQTQKAEYFKLCWVKRLVFSFRGYYHTTFLYHLLIVLPPIGIASMFYFSSAQVDKPLHSPAQSSVIEALSDSTPEN